VRRHRALLCGSAKARQGPAVDVFAVAGVGTEGLALSAVVSRSRLPGESAIVADGRRLLCHWISDLIVIEPFPQKLATVRPLDFDIPWDATSRGELSLTW
jgi:hypothetical protein